MKIKRQLKKLKTKKKALLLGIKEGSFEQDEPFTLETYQEIKSKISVLRKEYIDLL